MGKRKSSRVATEQRGTKRENILKNKRRTAQSKEMKGKKKQRNELRSRYFCCCCCCYIIIVITIIIITNYFKNKILKEEIESKCRLCKQHEETIDYNLGMPHFGEERIFNETR
jgi:hypothetical protein